MTRPSPTVWLATGVGIAAAALSVGRLLLANTAALSTLVWAEDGLFPLCVRAHNPLACMADPFAGYLLFLPRVVAWPVSWVPMEQWPLATNLAAALLAALIAALIAILLHRQGVGPVAAAFVALLPTLVPIMGFEAINATASSYMLLVFLAALALCFPTEGRYPTAAYAGGALVVALTIPSSAILLLPLAYGIARRRIPVRGGLITAAAMGAGLLAQFVVVVSAAHPRSLDWSLTALDGWFDVLPSAMLSFLPGTTSLTAQGSITSPLEGAAELGLLVPAAIVVVGFALLFVASPTFNGVGLLIVVGLLVGAIPAAAGYANNRYYVIPLLLWLAGVVIALDHWIRWRPNWVMAVVAAVLVASWVPGLEATAFRSSAVPEWGPMLAAARSACAVDPLGSATIMFSPSWPFVDAVFLGPTDNVVPCAAIG